MIEVEVKALANNLTKKTLEDNYYRLFEVETQLNHYFSFPIPKTPDNSSKLLEALKPYLNPTQYKELVIALKATGLSIRTREITGSGGLKTVLFIAKYSLVDDNHANGKVRKEIEASLDIDLVTLDNLLLDAGLNYASKWSRKREIYRNFTSSFRHVLCLDTNAGYGKLVEVEVMVSTPEQVEEVKPHLRYALHQLGLAELDDNLLSKMFDYYQSNWDKFYGTENLIWDDPEFVKSLSQTPV